MKVSKKFKSSPNRDSYRDAKMKDGSAANSAFLLDRYLRLACGRKTSKRIGEATPRLMVCS